MPVMFREHHPRLPGCVFSKLEEAAQTMITEYALLAACLSNALKTGWNGADCFMTMEYGKWTALVYVNFDSGYWAVFEWTNVPSHHTSSEFRMYCAPIRHDDSDIAKLWRGVRAGTVKEFHWNTFFAAYMEHGADVYVSAYTHNLDHPWTANVAISAQIDYRHPLYMDMLLARDHAYSRPVKYDAADVG